MPIPIEHSPITPDDLRPVFRVLCGIDGHQRSADDVDAWMLAATAGRWTRAQVAAATLALTSGFTGFRIMPGHMGQQITTDRDRIRTQWYCPDPPRELADDPPAEIAWRRQAARDFSDRALFALASGSPLEDVPMTLTPETTPIESTDARERIRQMCAAVGTRKAIPAKSDAVEPRRMRAAMDPHRRAAAAAELETVRHRTDEESA